MKQQNLEPKSRNDSKIILIIVGFLVILLMIITVFSFWQRNSFRLIDQDQGQTEEEYRQQGLEGAGEEEIIIEESIDESVDWKMYQNDLFQISYPMAWVHKDCSYNFDAICLCPDYVDDCGVMSGGGSMPNTSIILSWSNYDMTGRVSGNSDIFHTFENNQGEIRATISLSHDEYREEFDKIIESFKYR